MNRFLRASVKLISRHGRNVTFVSVQEGTYDPVTATVVNTETRTIVKAFKESVKVTQYNYPNLIDKEVFRFHVAGSSLTTVPQVQDKILDGTDEYIIVERMQHDALGETVLHVLTAVKN